MSERAVLNSGCEIYSDVKHRSFEACIKKQQHNSHWSTVSDLVSDLYRSVNLHHLPVLTSLETVGWFWSLGQEVPAPAWKPAPFWWKRGFSIMLLEFRSMRYVFEVIFHGFKNAFRLKDEKIMESTGPKPHLEETWQNNLKIPLHY